MDFDFSDEQMALRDAVRRWVERGYGFERRRAISAAGGFDRGVWGELAELGLTGLTVPEAHGGLGQGPVEAMVVLEELGRGIVLEPLHQAFIASAVLARYAPEPLAARSLAALASGESLVVLAHHERAARHRLDACAARAEPSDGGWRVSGTKSVVPAGDRAQAFIVPARLQGDMALFLVAADAPGLRTRGYPTLDGGRAAELHLESSPAELITRDGAAALAFAVDHGIAACCAEAVGTMEQTLAITVDYLNTRRQFGVPIASFQALRHRVADMKMQLELARSMSYYVTLKLGAPEVERRMAAARAKVQIGQAARFIGQQAVQLHGGIAVTDEYIVSHHFRRLTQVELMFGDTLHHLGEVSARMQETAGVFA